MEMVLAVVGVFVALLSVAALVVTARANKAHADNNQVLAEQLDTFEEAIVLARDVGARVAGGEPLPSAIASVGGTAAAHDLLRRFKTFAHLALVLVVLSLLGGCISKGEYIAFVKASRAFYDGAAPIVTRSVNADPELSDQSKKNRTSFVDDFRLSLEAAEKRSSGQ